MRTATMTTPAFAVDLDALTPYVDVRRRPSRATYLRRRLAVALVTVVVAVAVGLVARAALGSAVQRVADGAMAGVERIGAAAGPEGPPTDVWRDAPDEIVVGSGDTLWAIARRLQPEGDIRPLVAELTARHGSAELHPGDVIRLRG